MVQQIFIEVLSKESTLKDRSQIEARASQLGRTGKGGLKHFAIWGRFYHHLVSRHQETQEPAVNLGIKSHSLGVGRLKGSSETAEVGAKPQHSTG